jgi:hypothetical protein
MLTEYSVLQSAVGSGRPRPSIGSEEEEDAPGSLIAEGRGQAAPKEMEEEEEEEEEGKS